MDLIYYTTLKKLNSNKFILFNSMIATTLANIGIEAKIHIKTKLQDLDQFQTPPFLIIGVGSKATKDAAKHTLYPVWEMKNPNRLKPQELVDEVQELCDYLHKELKDNATND